MRLLSTIAALTVAACLAVVPVSAAVADPADAPGADVSHWQCPTPAVSGQSFGIVGVNDGLGNTKNHCLDAELTWSASSTGATAQPATALYVMAQDPGTAASWWPTRIGRTREPR